MLPARDCLPPLLATQYIPMASPVEVVRKRPAAAGSEKRNNQGKLKQKDGKPSRSGTPGWQKSNGQRKSVRVEEKKDEDSGVGKDVSKIDKCVGPDGPPDGPKLVDKCVGESIDGSPLLWQTIFDLPPF